MQIETTPLAGLVVLTPRRFSDPRGHFSETWNRETLRAAGIDTDFVQDNESLSRPIGTLRGLHCQIAPQAQAKLVRVAAGAVWDVAVDARPGSPTKGRWFGTELTAENGRQLYIPEGFLHGFVTLMPDTVFVYRCSAGYAPETERSVRWDDPDLGIDWPLPAGEPLLSEKDAVAGPWTRFAGELAEDAQ